MQPSRNPAVLIDDTPWEGYALALQINFIAINVNTLNRDSTVAVGENNQPGWSSHSKNNYGTGMLFGFSVTTNTINNIYDPDLVDAPINDPDIVPGAQNQAL